MSEESILITVITIIDDYFKFGNGFFLNIKELINNPLIHKIIIYNNNCKDVHILEVFNNLDTLDKVYTDTTMVKYELSDLKYNICKQCKTLHVFYMDQHLKLNCLDLLLDLYIDFAKKQTEDVFTIDRKEAAKYFIVKSIREDNFFAAINIKRVSPQNFSLYFLNINPKKVKRYFEEVEELKKN